MAGPTTSTGKPRAVQRSAADTITNRLFGTDVARTKTRLRKYVGVYLLLVIPVVYLLVYRYYPILLQAIIAFKDYKISKGIFGSEWYGLGNFRELFAIRDIGRVVRNTVVISLLRLTCGFFPPIILAIFLYDLHLNALRRASQTILYIPHFFSWVII